MESGFEKLWRLGPAAFVLKAIVVAAAADALLLALVLLRRAYRKRYFARRDARVFELRQKWEELISGQLPYKSWRKKPFDRRIVEAMVLDAFEAAGPLEAARLLKFLRTSGLIEKRIFEARKLTGWRRLRALVALGRTRAPEGIPALAEGLRDAKAETRLAALRGLGRMWARLLWRPRWGVLSRGFFLQFLLFGYAFATVISIGSVLQEEVTYKRYNDWQDVARLVSYCFLEHFPYRQMHMVWRLRGMWQYLRGDNTWEPLKRKGLESASVP